MNDVYSRVTVSIGLFVYNGASSIREALDSILTQTYRNFELIISDNASTDNTEEICREYAKNDARIRYIRQAVNLGASANCQFVLDEAQGEYFMWAAHDDTRSSDFLELNLEFLQEHSDYVASTSQVRFKGALPDPMKMGDRSLDQESQEERFLACCSTWQACGRFYSLMRRAVIANSEIITNGNYIGADAAFILELAICGKLNRLDRGYVELGRTGMSGSGKMYRAYRNGLLSWIIPFHELNRVMLKQSEAFSTQAKYSIWKLMAKMNFVSFLHQIKTEIKLIFIST